MRTTTVRFPLRAWRLRMRWTQDRAAAELGLSLDGYRRAEYRNEDRRNSPCNKTVALLAQALEQKEYPI